jgi:hypothetical protein
MVHFMKNPLDCVKQFCDYLPILPRQAKREPMQFQNASVNNKLLRTPMCLSQTVNSTSQDSDHQTEEEQDPVCKPVKDFLGE